MPELRAISPLYGPYFAWASTCAGLPIKPASKPHEIRAAGTPPILVVGTTRDPATPYKWAQGLANQLEAGVLLTYDGDGHGAYTNDTSWCVSKAVDAYLIEGTVPAKGTTC